MMALTERMQTVVGFAASKPKITGRHILYRAYNEQNHKL